MPAKRATLSQDDLDLIREMYTMIGETKAIVQAVQAETSENTRTLRGHNGTKGLLTMFTSLEERVADVDAKIEAVKVQMKDVPAAIDTWKQYPSLTWIARHKFKEMSIITAAVVAVTILVGFPNYYVGERLQMLIELLFAKWLRL
jgi:hypothetical protein